MDLSPSSIDTNLFYNKLIEEKRFSHRMKRKRNSILESTKENDEKENVVGKSASKDTRKSQRKPEKRKLFNPIPNIAIRKNKHKVKQKVVKKIVRSSSRKKKDNAAEKTPRIIRSSNREKKKIDYAEILPIDSEDSEEYDSDTEDSEEYDSEDSEIKKKNKIKMKKTAVPKIPAFIAEKKDLSEYELMVERNKEANRKMLEEMGIFQAKKDLVAPQKKRKEEGDMLKLIERDYKGLKVKITVPMQNWLEEFSEWLVLDDSGALSCKFCNIVLESKKKVFIAHARDKMHKTPEEENVNNDAANDDKDKDDDGDADANDDSSDDEVDSENEDDDDDSLMV